MTHRVIQWATGQVGMPALRGIIDHPDLELVGLLVTSEAKEGRDGGELCGTSPTGVRATRDRDAILALDADCVSYAATDVGRVEAVIDDLCAILASGKNVVNNSITRLVHPAAMEPEIVKRLQQACEQGGTTLFNTGIHPGVVSDAMLFALTSLAQRIDSISAAELLDCSCYDPVVIHALGFGKTVEQDAAEFDTAILHYYWGPVISALAEAFRLELDEIRVFRHVHTVDEAFTMSSGLEIPAGTIGAIHYGLEGVVDRRVRITAENYEKSRPEVHPDGWPMFPIHHDRPAGGYRILVRGEPDMQLDLAFGGPDPLVDVLAATGMAAVNAVPAVCGAPPGVIGSFAELPHLHGFMLS
jgi:4-hydroxy-tetrahydrodipicolinate reductase